MVTTFLLIWGCCLVGGLSLWLVSLVRRDVSIVDIFWGPGFLLAAALAWWHGGRSSAWHLLLLAMVAAWALRLALHIAWRGRGHGEDRRYAAMREKHGPRFRWLSLFTVFLLQGTLVTLLAAPLVIVLLRPIVRPAWCVAGSLLWLAGVLCEAVADAQLLAFQRTPGSRGRVLDSGLWRYSRHPNYFGEALLWWGFGVFALGVAGGFWTLFAPLGITLLLLRVSGVPMLEAGIEQRRPGYRDYIERTSSFLPLPPRRRGGG
jgi:steroid 5-alpha reductase family enzyme